MQNSNTIYVVMNCPLAFRCLMAGNITADWNPPTVADTKRKFYETFRKPVSGIYNNVIQELLVQQHIMRYNKKYQYDEVSICLRRLIAIHLCCSAACHASWLVAQTDSEIHDAQRISVNLRRSALQNAQRDCSEGTKKLNIQVC